ncbi:MAG TPA: hypothetical protein VK708_00365 [Bryobacteraceae bacterium]|jgi:hypothetical protein|nr:hypothetical protein [Bryobacteraceae bacterium]
MPADPQYLRDHYASLSDEALLAIERDDLVDLAQRCYDDEVGRRKLASRTARSATLEDEDEELDEELLSGDEPDWLNDASEVLTRADRPGSVPTDAMVEARDALEAAGIPCHIELSEIPETNDASPPPTHLWRLLVPGNLNLRATSVLERDIFNHDFEAEWQAHLEMLSDEELRGMKPEVAFCGLFDRVERVTRAYDEEIARRSRL